jgi:ABC-type siderophore export system fused ATPase/permease subunit
VQAREMDGSGNGYWRIVVFAALQRALLEAYLRQLGLLGFSLADFGRVWALEDDPAKRRRLLATLFDRVWQDGGTIVAVKPREAFLCYFQTADKLARRRERSAVSKRERRDSNPRPPA